MITKNNLDELYKWAKDIKFPLKKAPTSTHYSNKDIYICGLKFVRKNVNIRKNLMTELIYDIIKDDDILYAVYTTFEGGTDLRPHKDPDVYSDRYKRIQIPLRVPVGAYMLWREQRVTWVEGESQMYPVMDYIHEAHNPSQDPIEFIFLDVKMNTEVEL
tara:strand:- start:698 stop:1174 length:477 start_codon:yes stop_codon:yes gene_type:complete